MIGRKTSLAIVNMVVGVVLGLVAQKLIALYFGDVYFGQVMFALGAMGVLFFITDLGMGQAHVKRVSEGYHAGDCFATFAVFKVASTALFVLLIALGLWVYTGVLGRTIEDTTIPVVVIILLYYVAKSIQEIGQSSFEARLEMARLQVTSFADTVVRVGVTIAVALIAAAVLHRSGPLFGRIDLDHPVVQWVRAEPAAALALAITAGGIAAAVAAIVMFLRIRERGRFRPEILRDYASFALPLFLTSAVYTISANIDAAVIGQFLSAGDTGVFAGVRRIVFVLSGVAPALGALLFPSFSALAARGEHETVARQMNASIRYLSMFILPAVAFTIVFAESVIRLTLSDDFLRGATTMGILAAYVYVMTISTPHANLLMGLGQPRAVAQIGVATAATVVILDLVLVPKDIRSLGIPLANLGIEGAAIGTLASGLLYYALARRATRQHAHYREDVPIWKHVAAAGAMIALLAGLDMTVLPLVHWYHFGLYTAVGGVVYFGALALLGEFTRKDVEMVRHSVHPIEMLRYVRDELRSRRKD